MERDVEPSGITYLGPEIDDPAVMDLLPADHRELLETRNGFILFAGGLHVRGACTSPDWHSLRKVWLGGFALHEFYPALEKSDVPFAQDCLGDQFILRQGVVYRLSAEDGVLENKEVGLEEFLTRAGRDPVQYLSLQPLLQHYNEGGELEPGQLLNVYPPYCTKEAERGVSIGAISMFERLGFLAEFSKAISSLPEGAQVKVVVSGSDPKDQLE
jgi:hypothetical protein